MQRFGQRLGAGGQRHAAVLAHQQGVVEVLAQLRQGVAYRRLAAVQAQGGASHMLFAQQGVQGEQQVEVDLA